MIFPTVHLGLIIFYKLVNIHLHDTCHIKINSNNIGRFITFRKKLGRGKNVRRPDPRSDQVTRSPCIQQEGP